MSGGQTYDEVQYGDGNIEMVPREELRRGEPNVCTLVAEPEPLNANVSAGVGAAGEPAAVQLGPGPGPGSKLGPELMARAGEQMALEATLQLARGTVDQEDVPLSGACLFHAIIQEQGGAEAQELRERVVAHVALLWERGGGGGGGEVDLRAVRKIRAPEGTGKMPIRLYTCNKNQYGF